jgi:hypothetical protein
MREVFPTNGPKLLARLMNVPIRTAKCWYYGNLAKARQREVILGLIQEMARQDERRAEIRKQLKQIVGTHEIGNDMDVDSGTQADPTD